MRVAVEGQAVAHRCCNEPEGSLQQVGILRERLPPAAELLIAAKRQLTKPPLGPLDLARAKRADREACDHEEEAIAEQCERATVGVGACPFGRRKALAEHRA